MTAHFVQLVTNIPANLKRAAVNDSLRLAAVNTGTAISNRTVSLKEILRDRDTIKTAVRLD